MVKKIVNGVIVDGSEQPNQSDDGMGCGGSFNFFGYKIPVWMIALIFTFTALFGGFKGLTLLSILFFIAYICQSNGNQARPVIQLIIVVVLFSRHLMPIQEQRQKIHGMRDLPQTPANC